MKSILARILALSMLLGIYSVAAADTTVRVVFICTVNEGKSIDDVRAFIYADDYPSIESWSATRDATTDNDEGKAIAAALDAAGTCESNSLYTAEVS